MHMVINRLDELIMKKIIEKWVMCSLCVAIATGCEDKVNDWDVDPAHRRLFKSLVFESYETLADSIGIRYSQTISADKYIFEFAKDSLKFEEIVSAVTILADTLTPYVSSNVPARVEYLTWFGDLEGNTPYSVRMKGVNTTTGEESKYSELYFQTAAEQLFDGWRIYIDRIVTEWEPTDRATHISLVDAVTGELLQQYELTPQDKENGRYEIAGLDPGTAYRVAIYNNDIERGVIDFQTSGVSGGFPVPVNPGDDVAAMVSAAVAQGHSAIVLLFEGGKSYNLDRLVLPEGVSSVSFTGVPDASGAKPDLNLRDVSLSGLAFGEIVFEAVNILGASGSGHFINLAADGLEIEAYTFRDCYIANFGSSVIRLSNNDIRLKKISFENCMVHRIGGWGVVNIGGNNVAVDSVSFTNSTLTDLATQLMDVRAAVGEIVIGNCTFYNQNAAMSQLLRFDTNNLPQLLTTYDNIFAGTNSGGKINAVSYDYASYGLVVSFAGSYHTNELEIERESRGFADITVFDGSAEDLFVDPENGNFRIKPDNGFGGRATAGDARWRE